MVDLTQSHTAGRQKPTESAMPAPDFQGGSRNFNRPAGRDEATRQGAVPAWAEHLLSVQALPVLQEFSVSKLLKGLWPLGLSSSPLFRIRASWLQLCESCAACRHHLHCSDLHLHSRRRCQKQRISPARRKTEPAHLPPTYAPWP